ncbi:FAD-dependent oxidoreductase, partial [Desulfothermus naphthae]
TEKEMPALPEEVKAAKEEGVNFLFLAAPQEVLHENGKVVGLRCIKMELGEPDSSGRRRPIPIPDSEFDLEVDQIAAAIGQRPDISCLEDVTGIDFTRWSTIETNSISYATNREGVFAGGDCQSGPWIVIGAVAAGKEVAISIERYLNGEDLEAGREPKKIDENFEYRPIPETESPKERAKERELPVEERKGNFKEVELGLTEEEGRKEAERCINCSYCCECFQCVKACGAGAVTLETHAQQKEEEILEVGAVVLAPGFNPYNPKGLDNYGYGLLPNVVTAMQFERILSASGPTGGHLVRPSDHKEPKKIAWLQCVGSRDINRCEHGYCSSVCCMYAIKEAVIAKEHAGSDLECAIFYMDMRTYGKDFERYYEQAKEKHGVKFIRSRIHTIDPVPGSDDLIVRYFDESGEMKEEQYDMIVLSVGLETAKDSIELASVLGVELTKGKFCQTSSFKPVSTSKEGIFVCGAFQGPKDIPLTVIDGSAAAAAASALLSDVRFTQTKEIEKLPERNIIGEPPRIGVFVCRCGTNIAGVIDVDAVRDYAATLPYVVHVEDNMYTCSQDTQDRITEIIKQKQLTRVVVASCSPKTHQALFQETLIKASLNKYVFEMANIRNEDSWVHRYNPEIATQKAKELVRMAVNKVIYKEPLEEIELNIDQRALVIGGGVAGLSAAINLAKQGYETHIVERTDKLGGNALKLYKTWTEESVKEGLNSLINEANSLDNLYIHLNSEIIDVDGFVGNFKTTIKNTSGEEIIEHGVTIIATGGAEYQPNEYLYGQDDRIKTHLELDKMFMDDEPKLKDVNTAVFIQCVGSREKDRPYCSRVCCSHSIESALEIKKRNPDAKVFILYRDIRTYGEREYLYEEARRKGVIFIRYNVDEKPVVTKDGDNLIVKVKDHITGLPLEIETDLLTLATAIVPYKDEKLAQFYKLPLNEDGFFVEKHAKLGPAEFATDGVYLCGLAHYPKSIDESIAQGLAASARAITLLAKKKIFSSGEVSVVDPRKCVGCGVCVTICPYSAPRIVEEEGPNQGKAEINPALCKGCGLCMASCRSGAISLKGMENQHVYAMIEAIAV